MNVAEGKTLPEWFINATSDVKGHAVCMKFLRICHIPYFLGHSPLFSSFPVTFLPVPDHFRMSYDYFHPFRPSLLSSWLFCHPFLLCFPSISVYLLVLTRSFQFSILGSDRSESGSLLLIRLHSVQPQSRFPLISVRYWSPIIWPQFPLQIMIHFLLFCSVYKSGKLSSHSLACKQTKHSVTWLSINLNTVTQSLSVSVLAS